MTSKHFPPAFQRGAFNCPHCHAFAQQLWSTTLYQTREIHAGSGIGVSTILGDAVHYLRQSTCVACGSVCVWYANEMVHPRDTTAPPANEDMPEDVRKVFDEAREVLPVSPRASAALLRLALQRLLPHVGGKGENINNDIAELKAKLPAKVGKAMDFVRVVGNNAVHPGQIAVDEDPKTAHALFLLLNLIVESSITEERMTDELFGALPEDEQEWIEKRDQKQQEKQERKDEAAANKQRKREERGQ